MIGVENMRNHKSSSRTKYLESSLHILGYSNALRALDLVMETMCVEKDSKDIMERITIII